MRAQAATRPPDSPESVVERYALAAPPLVAIACSGGGDSTTLAHIAVPALRRRGKRAVLLHLDHGLRGRGSRDDAAFVSRLAAQLGVPLVRRTRRPDRALVRDVGLQAAARHLRRSFLRAAARRAGASACLLAHHAGDQAETLAIQALRGRHPALHAPMPADDGFFVRPLLALPRAAVEAAAKAHGWTSRHDPSNDDLRFLRARVRHAAPSDRAGRSSEALNRRPARTYVHEAARGAVPAVVIRATPYETVLDRSALAHLEDPLATAMLQQLTRRRDGRRPPSRRALGRLLQASRDGVRHPREVQLGQGLSARVTDVVTLAAEARRELPAVATAVLPAADAVRLAASSRDRVVAAPIELLPRLRLSVAGRGRRMRPFGGRGSALLRDLLAARGVPVASRAAWPVVEADGEILWLAGVRRSSLHPVPGTSGDALVLYTVAPRVAPARGLERSP